MSQQHATGGSPLSGGQDQALLGLYDHAVVEVYRYLRARCGTDHVAEDLTSETFVAAVDAIRRSKVSEVTVAWLIGIARHKLVDHWRRIERQQKLTDVSQERSTAPVDDDPWDIVLDAMTTRSTLEALGPHHRGALTLRYLDGLGVADVASHLGRSVGATEVLLVRARKAFRTNYERKTTTWEEDR